MKTLLFALLLSLSLATQAQQLLTNSDVVGLIKLEPMAVLAQQPSIYIAKTATGYFEISNLSVGSGSPVLIRGNVTNKTGHDWSDATFQIVLYDPTGKPFDSAELFGLTFNIYGIKDGETRGIGLKQDGNYMTYSGQPRQASRMEIQFLKGSSPVAYDVAMLKPATNKELKFEDNLIAVRWFFNNKQLAFELRNKTENPVKVDWNQVSYVDVGGKAEKVMHGGVKFISRNEPQPSTTIPPNAKIEDFVYPTANVYYSSGRYTSGWKESPMFPNSEDALVYKGKSFSVFLPLEINGGVKNYSFSFSIEDVRFLPLPETKLDAKANATAGDDIKPKTCYEGGRKVLCP